MNISDGARQGVAVGTRNMFAILFILGALLFFFDTRVIFRPFFPAVPDQQSAALFDDTAGIQQDVMEETTNITLSHQTDDDHHVEQSTSPSVKSYYDDEFRICRTEDPKTLYYCAGPSYDKFTDRMKTYILNKANSSSWGRYPYPSPKANQKVLFFGNSHLRQLFLELKCQYQDQLKGSGKGSLGIGPSAKFGLVDVAIFERNITLVCVANHYLVYSKVWDVLLEEMLGFRLEDFDAFVLGQFNVPANSKNTNFERWVKNATADMPNVNFNTQPPPDLSDILDRISRLEGPQRPVVYTSMWAKYNMRGYERNKAQGIKWLKAQNKIVPAKGVSFVNVRDHVAVLGECGSDHSAGKDCTNINKAHRCIGKKGGHPTLGVYDVLESLYKFFL